MTDWNRMKWYAWSGLLNKTVWASQQTASTTWLFSVYLHLITISVSPHWYRFVIIFTWNPKLTRHTKSMSIMLVLHWRRVMSCLSLCASAPGSTPLRVRARPLSSSSVVVEWDEPIQTNGVIRVRTISCTFSLIHIWPWYLQLISFFIYSFSA